MFHCLSKISIFTIVFTLTACGGGGGGGGNSANTPAENEVQEVATQEQSEPVVILDNYDPIDGSQGNVYNSSRASGEQYASYFSVSGNTIVNAITWAGVALDDTTLGDEEATFIIRVYSGDNLPSDVPVAESTVLASASLLGSMGLGSIYEFSFEDSTIFSLSPGSYWLSVVDPETEHIGFLWPVERDSASVTRGNGGAFRASEDSAWESVNSGVPAREARGRNLLIEGK